MRFVLLGSLMLLTACNAVVGGPALISGQSPNAAQARNSEPQPPGSLPLGAEGIGQSPIGRQINLGSITASM